MRLPASKLCDMTLFLSETISEVLHTWQQSWCIVSWGIFVNVQNLFSGFPLHSMYQNMIIIWLKHWRIISSFVIYNRNISVLWISAIISSWQISNIHFNKLFSTSNAKSSFNVTLISPQKISELVSMSCSLRGSPKAPQNCKQFITCKRTYNFFLHLDDVYLTETVIVMHFMSCRLFVFCNFLF